MNVAERPYYPLVSSVVVRAFRTPLTLVVAFALFFPSSPYLEWMSLQSLFKKGDSIGDVRCRMAIVEGMKNVASHVYS